MELCGMRGIPPTDGMIFSDGALAPCALPGAPGFRCAASRLQFYPLAMQIILVVPDVVIESAVAVQFQYLGGE